MSTIDARALQSTLVVTGSILSWLLSRPLPAQEPASPPDVSTRPAVECPAWAREQVPEWVEPFRGRFGLPDPYPRQKEEIGGKTTGIDKWQANHFVAYRAETTQYLYDQYTPVTVRYRPGTFPRVEAVARRFTAGLSGDRQKALALLTGAMPEVMSHPAIPPYCGMCPPDRAIDEDALIESGEGWCNEQARVFVRLCQVSGIPARMIFLFYSDARSGHVIAEFFADGRWSMADTSWACVFPARDGHLMSAAECHDDESAMMVGEAYVRRVREILKSSDEKLAWRRFKHITDPQERTRKIAEFAAQKREYLRALTPKEMGEPLWAFGVLNLPMPKGAS